MRKTSKIFVSIFLLVFITTIVCAAMPGDLNSDGLIDSRDYMLMTQHILGQIEVPLELADLNGDGLINSLDASLLGQYILTIIDEFPIDKEDPIPEDPPPGALFASVDQSVRHQNIEGFGASIAWYNNWLPPHPNKEDIYDLIFAELGINILRLNNWYSVYEGSEEFDPDTQEIVEAANESLGEPITIFMSSWSPPDYLKSNNDVAGGTLKRENGQFVYDQFANFWYDSLRAYEEVGIVPKYISIQNEPDIATSYESCLFDPHEGTNASYARALDAVYNRLHSSMQNPPLIVGPEVLGIGYNNLQNYTNTMDLNQIDALGFHLYHGGDENNPDTFNQELARISNEFDDFLKYQTEYYRGSPFNTAWIMHNTLTVGNVNMYLFWDLIWGTYDDNALVVLEHSWEEEPWETEEGYIVTDHYYAFKHFSAYIDENYTRIDASVESNDIKISAYICPDDSSITVVLLNTSYNSEIVALDLNDFNYRNSDVYRTYGDDEKTAYIGSLGAGYSVEMPGRSIATVVINR
ncbi:dockerin type I domain-containing protein [Natronospora cellulosivora (SeqCode)]